MNTKHTPGPWKVFRTDAGELDSITTMDGLCVASTVTFYGNNQGEANARLIAAAPDLLAALYQIATYDPTKWDAVTLGNIAREAIVKAGG